MYLTLHPQVLFLTQWILVVSLVVAIFLDRITLVRKCCPVLELNDPFVLIVTLRGSPANRNFRGFMIQGRVRADDSPAGTFGSASNYQPRCSGNVSSNNMHYIVVITYVM